MYIIITDKHTKFERKLKHTFQKILYLFYLALENMFTKALFLLLCKESHSVFYFNITDTPRTFGVLLQRC